MTSRSPKPVKQCEGCQLNLDDHCLAFHYPKEKWREGLCEGYNNEHLLKIYRIKNDGKGAHASKIRRQQQAKEQKNVEHPEDHSKFKKIKFP